MIHNSQTSTAPRAAFRHGDFGQPRVRGRFGDSAMKTIDVVRTQDITNQAFGQLTVLQFSSYTNGKSCWTCRCVCGKTVVVRGYEIRSGRTKSCGCRRFKQDRVQPLFDNEDAELRLFDWRPDLAGYPRSKPAGNLMLPKERHAHRIVVRRMIGRALLSGEIVDHKNCNRMDCRRQNLRITDGIGNAQNRGPNSKSAHGFRGVSFNKTTKKWYAKVGHRRRSVYVGIFDNPNEAALAAADKRRELGFLGEEPSNE